MTYAVVNISPLELQKIRTAGELLQQLANGDDFNLPGANFRTRIKKQLGLLSEDIPWRGNHTSYENYLRSCWEFFKNVFNRSNCHNDNLAEICVNTNNCEIPSELIDISQILRNNTENLDIYIHGSMARGDFTAFSDIDDLIIFNNNNFADNFDSFASNINTLRQTAIEYQCIDPLQHHGHWVFAEIHLKTGLCEKMPPEVLSAGTFVVKGRDKLQFLKHENLSYAKQIFNSNYNCVLELADKLHSGAINAEQLKLLCSGAALLPALVMQIQSQPTDKASAIADFISNGPQFVSEALIWTGKIRDNFGDFINIAELRRQASQLADNGLMRSEIYAQIINTLSNIDINLLPDHERFSELFKRFAQWCKEITER